MADADGDGKLSRQEVEELFKSLDQNQDGVITFEEWCAHVAKCKSLSPEKLEDAKALFKLLDKDGSGSITLEELQHAAHTEYIARCIRSTAPIQDWQPRPS